MSTVHSLPRIRPAGHLEKFSTTRHALGLYNSIGISAYYSKLTQSKNLDAIIHRALTQVVAQHPALSSIPVDEDSSSAYYARIPQVDVRDVVFFVDCEDTSFAEDTLKEVLNSQHSTNFKNNYGNFPFWRLIVLRNPEVPTAFVASFVYSHSIGDGQSGLAFHRHFHAAMLSAEVEEAAGNLPFETVVKSPNTALDPPLEDLHTLPLSPRYLLAGQWNEWFPKRKQGDWRGIPISFDIKSRERRCSWITFSQGAVQKLRDASRQHSVTLTATVQAALVTSIFAHLPTDYEELNADGAVSLRRFISTIDDDRFGNFVSRYMCHHIRSDLGEGIDKDRLWAEARKVKTAIDTEIQKDGRNSVVGLLRWAGPLKPFFEKRDGKPRDESFELSNIGVFKHKHEPTDNEWKVGRMVFSQSADVCGPPIHVTLVTGGDGCLTACFSWLDTMLDADWVEKVARDLEKTVMQLI